MLKEHEEWEEYKRVNKHYYPHVKLLQLEDAMPKDIEEDVNTQMVM